MPEIAENAPVHISARKNRRGRRILIFCVVSLLNVGLLALLLTQLLTPASKSGGDPLIGHPAPEFSLAMLRSSTGTGKLSLSNFKGKAVILNFWASWCAPCTEESPLLERTWEQVQAQSKDVVFVGIDFQETSSAASGFIQQYGITYPIVLDANGAVANKYGITSLPDTIFIDKNGTVISKESREITAPVLSSNLKLIT